MATETLTVALGVDDDRGDVHGKDFVGDEDDTQIVTITDGGDLEGETFEFAFWGKKSPNNPGEGPGGSDTFIIDLADFEENFAFTVKSMEPTDVFQVSGWDTWTTVGSVHTFTYTGTDGGTYNFVIDAQSTNGSWGEATVVCFAEGTRILTPDGEREVGSLSAGDMVVCGDGQHRPIRWIGWRQLDEATLRDQPELRPIRIEAGALGRDLPARPLRLSPQHRVRIDDWRAALLFGQDSVLAPAKALVNGSSVTVDRTCRSVRYHHILLDDHQTVLADGLPCETLMPAEVALTGLSAEARAEILMLLPDLSVDLAAYGRLCLSALTAVETRLIFPAAA